jgi:hypothetical protein
METQFMNAELKCQHPLINWSGLSLRGDRGLPRGSKQPRPGSGDPLPPRDPEAPGYADLGGDETKDDYPYPGDQSTGDPEPPGEDQPSCG